MVWAAGEEQAASNHTERGQGGNSWVQGLTKFANALLTVCAQLHITFKKGPVSLKQPHKVEHSLH